MFAWLIKTILGIFTGGSLEKILDVIEHKMDDETKKEEIKAEVTKTWINAQANLLVGRTWWFQLFFVLPFGLWLFTSIMIILSQALFGSTLSMPALPPPLDEWAGWIISSIFIVDQSKAIIGRLAGAFGKGN